MENAEQDRTEAPTRFKLARARRKGQVARGRDLGYFTVLAAFLAYAGIAGPDAAQDIARAARAAIVAGPELAGGDAAVGVMSAVLSAGAERVVQLAGVLFLAVLITELIQTGPVFSSQPMKLDFSRLNPGRGLKQVFSLNRLLETLKNVSKIAAYLVVGWMVILGSYAKESAAMTDASALAQAIARTGFKLLAAYAGLALLFAAIDQVIVRREFFKQMRMSRRELKREFRDREGEPRLKQKRKQMHAEFSKLSQSLRGIRGADVLITNPIHFAVALRYDQASMGAPKVVARGSHRFALRLRKLAFLYGVDVLHDPPLARKLFSACPLNQEIPETFYREVSDVYIALRRREAMKKAA